MRRMITLSLSIPMKLCQLRGMMMLILLNLIPSFSYVHFIILLVWTLAFLKAPIILMLLPLLLGKIDPLALKFQRAPSSSLSSSLVFHLFDGTMSPGLQTITRPETLTTNSKPIVRLCVSKWCHPFSPIHPETPNIIIIISASPREFLEQKFNSNWWWWGSHNEDDDEMRWGESELVAKRAKAGENELKPAASRTDLIVFDGAQSVRWRLMMD